MKAKSITVLTGKYRIPVCSINQHLYIRAANFSLVTFKKILIQVLYLAFSFSIGRTVSLEVFAMTLR